jgi:GABA(A) receptor-associated protein
MDKLLGKYPDRVPVMVQSKAEGDAETQVLKYMVPRDRTIAQMIVQLRKHIQMTPKQAVYLFVNNTLPPNSATVGEIWEQHRNAENVLHIVYSLENTFG